MLKKLFIHGEHGEKQIKKLYRQGAKDRFL